MVGGVGRRDGWGGGWVGGMMRWLGVMGWRVGEGMLGVMGGVWVDGWEGTPV